MRALEERGSLRREKGQKRPGIAGWEKGHRGSFPVAPWGREFISPQASGGAIAKGGGRRLILAYKQTRPCTETGKIQREKLEGFRQSKDKGGVYMKISTATPQGERWEKIAGKIVRVRGGVKRNVALRVSAIVFERGRRRIRMRKASRKR